MTDFLLTEDGDLDISSGTIRLTVDGSPEELRQRVVQNLRAIQGEWFLNLAEGVPYLTEILIARPNLAHIRTALRRTILETPGVQRVTDLITDFDRAARVLRVTARINYAVDINEELER